MLNNNSDSKELAEVIVFIAFTAELADCIVTIVLISTAHNRGTLIIEFSLAGRPLTVHCQQYVSFGVQIICAE